MRGTMKGLRSANGENLVFARRFFGAERAIFNACRHLSCWRSYFSPFIFRQPFREAASVDPQETGKKWRAENERGRNSTSRNSTRFNQPLESGKSPFFTRQVCTFFVIGLRSSKKWALPTLKWLIESGGISAG